MHRRPGRPPDELVSLAGHMLLDSNGADLADLLAPSHGGMEPFAVEMVLTLLFSASLFSEEKVRQ